MSVELRLRPIEGRFSVSFFGSRDTDLRSFVAKNAPPVNACCSKKHRSQEENCCKKETQEESYAQTVWYSTASQCMLQERNTGEKLLQERNTGGKLLEERNTGGKLCSLIQCIRAVFFPGQVRHRFQQVPCLDTRGAEAALSNEPFTVTCS